MGLGPARQKRWRRNESARVDRHGWTAFAAAPILGRADLRQLEIFVKIIDFGAFRVRREAQVA
jgi:hypothetical protein